jgi:hypothetical protein
MNKKIQAILKKVYVDDTCLYNAKLERMERRIRPTTVRSDLTLLEDRGLKPNTFETFEHDDALNRFLKLKGHANLTLDFAAAMFLKGLTGEIQRGRQTLMSLLYTKNLTPHKFEGDTVCKICGLPKKETIDKTYQLFTYYSGESWNESPLNFLIELEETIRFPKPVITNTDLEKLDELLNFIIQADLIEVPWELEKRIATHKMLPNTDKYKRYGILQTLAECGILENDFIKPKYERLNTDQEINKALENMRISHRSEIPLPFGAWRGKNGVNFERYTEIFGKMA